MSAIHTWACFLLWIGLATQDKTPDVAVTCLVSEECILPCSFQPGGKEIIEWFRQDVVVYKFEREEEDDDDDDEADSQSSEEHYEHEQLAGRATIFPHLVSRGNATLILRSSGLKDRGTYRCHVRTSQGEHNAKVIVKVEAPIRGLSLELSRLSGFEEMKCIVHDVFPAPRVTWATEPPTFEDLRPVTRMLADKRGLYTVDSRLKMLSGQPNLIYICKVTTPYGGPPWTASLREREIRGRQGKDLTIPCSAPPYLNNPLLDWTFSNGKDDPSHILSFNSQSGQGESSSPWENHVELNGYMVRFGDGSLRLMDPDHSDHTGSYTCVFSMPYNSHTERTDVTIDDPTGQRSISEAPSYWWIFGVVAAVLVLAVAAMLVCLKFKGSTKKPRNNPEEGSELRSVKDPTAETHQNESSPLTAGGFNGPSASQTSTQLT